MAETTTNIDELLEAAGALFRAAHPPISEEEAAEQTRRSMERIATDFAARLDANNETACHLCNARRPRRPGEEAQYNHDCTTCPNARQFWHFRRDFTRPGQHDVRKFKVRKVFRLWFRIRPLRCRCF
ncbi:hypothetical protein [Streptomyces sp. NPDC057002]|uniref:hypothetical protein n=1 Tax=Streptomyces sp. NPDC057002 TaxID=3345992 RepID=UPI00363844EB